MMKFSSPSRNNLPAAVNEVAFIDTGVAGFQDLAKGVRPGMPVVLVDGRSDGLLQIARALKAFGPIHAVHIISHGEPGALLLGNTKVNEQSLRHYQDIWPTFRQALGESGKILLYGCEIAKGDIGHSFVDRFAELTSARVAASSNLVGNAEQGGSWELWYDHGSSAASLAPNLALTHAARANFNAVLAVLAGRFTFGSSSDTFSLTAGDDPATTSTIKSHETDGSRIDTGLMSQIITPGSQSAFIGLSPVDQTGAGVSMLSNGDSSLTFGGSSDAVAYIDRIRIYAANTSDRFKLDGFDFGFKFPSTGAVTSTTVSIVGYDSANHETGRLDLKSISGAKSNSVTSVMLALDAFQNISEFALVFADSVYAVQLDDLVIASAVTADITAPRVTSIDRQSPSAATTNADSLVFRVTFSEAVSNVDTADFSVTGITGALTSVNAAGGTAYDVTISGGDLANLDGTVTLGFAAGQNIADAAGNTLNTTPTGTNNPTYTIDNTAPRVTSIVRNTPAKETTNADSLVYTISFDSAVNNLDASDFAITGTTASITSIVSAGGDAYNVTLSGGDLASLNGTVTLGFAGGQNITDPAGNALNPAPTGTNHNTYIVSNLIPTTTVATAAFSADTGTSNSDFKTKTAAQTISGTLSANLLTGETVYVSLDNGGSWVPATATVGQQVWSLSGQTLTGNGTLQVKVSDEAGNDGPAFTQAYELDTTAPVFQSAAVNGNTLVMSYTDPATLDAANAPAATAFAVSAGGSAVAVNGVTVDAAAKTITLTLASAVASGQVVTVAYTDHSNSDDAIAIQDAAGNDAATLAAAAVTNNTVPQTSGGGDASGPTTPPPVTTIIDGISVVRRTVMNSDGTTSTLITIPVVSNTRQDQFGNGTVVDIPLVTTGSGANLLTAQVPVGFGLSVQGGAAPKEAGSSLTDLIREIKAHTATGSTDQNMLTGVGSGFLQGLSADTPFLGQTIVPNTASSTTAPTNPLVITGTPAGPGNPMTALVVDTRGLPSGTEIQLQHVEFAALIGAVKVTGGEGSQNVWGDSESQYIVLGAGDDILHGGAGDDIVGSAGGNDRIFGDEGSDLVFGGEGNDFIDGGTGIDTVRLVGSGRGDYAMRVESGKLILTHRNGAVHAGDGTDTVVNVEKLTFTGGDADMSARGAIARVYDAMFDRAPDGQGLEYWVKMSESGMSMTDIASQFVVSPEAQALLGSQTDAQFVDALYQRSLGRAADSAGHDYWVGMLEQGKADRATVMYSFANSEEKLAQEKANGHTLDFNRTDVATLVRMYDTLFDRKADTAGLNHWIAASENGMGLRDIANSFIQSEEALALFRGKSNTEFVEYLYKVGLERQGSNAEISAWAWQLEHGAINRADALLGFADSAEKIALIGVMSTSFETI